MATLSDHLKPKMDELKALAKENGTTVVQESLNMHRNKLERVSDMAVDKMEEEVPTASLGDTVKVYDITRKHLNTLDGRQSSEAATIAVIPGELAARFSLDNEINDQLEVESSSVRDTNKEQTLEGEIVE